MRITVEQASYLLDVPPQTIRKGLQLGTLDIGTCAKLGKRHYYVIVKSKLANLLDVTIDELEYMVLAIKKNEEDSWDSHTLDDDYSERKCTTEG